MARTVSPYGVLQDKVKEDFNAIDDPENHTFSEFFVNATNVLAAYGDSHQDTMANLCARGLLSWSQADRDAYLAASEVPGRVYQLMAAPGDWPVFAEPAPVVEDEA